MLPVGNREQLDPVAGANGSSTSVIPSAAA